MCAVSLLIREAVPSLTLLYLAEFVALCKVTRCQISCGTLLLLLTSLLVQAGKRWTCQRRPQFLQWLDGARTLQGDRLSQADHTC